MREEGSVCIPCSWCQASSRSTIYDIYEDVVWK